SADMLFSEPPMLAKQATTGDEAKSPKSTAQTRYEQLLEDDGWQQLLLKAAEVGPGCGDVSLRTVVDEDIAVGRAFPAIVHADAAVPMLRYGHLASVIFFRCLEE